MLTSFFIHRGSHESKDSSEAMQRSLDRIEARLRRLESAVARADDPPRATPPVQGALSPAALVAKQNGGSR